MPRLQSRRAPYAFPRRRCSKPDADLQDPLVEVADRVALLDPLELERLVLLEELAAVELLDALAKARRRRIAAAVRAPAAARSVSGCRGSAHRGASLGTPGPALVGSKPRPGQRRKAGPVAGAPGTVRTDERERRLNELSLTARGRPLGCRSAAPRRAGSPPAPALERCAARPPVRVGRPAALPRTRCA